MSVNEIMANVIGKLAQNYSQISKFELLIPSVTNAYKMYK